MAETNSSIDRINNNGHYSCGHCDDCIRNGWVMNCRWATMVEQARNTRRSRYLTLNGETKLLMDWAEKTGISDKTVRTRLRAGWSVERALTTPTKRQNRSTQRL